MNSNYKRRKLGIGLIDRSQVDNLKKDLENLSPVSFDKKTKEPLSYTNIRIKNINLGTLRKPKQVLTLVSEGANGEKYVEIQNPDIRQTSYFYAESESSIQTNGELLNYSVYNQVYPDNPYDPIFASFSRLTSFPEQTFVVSGVTGARFGEKERYFKLTTGFSQFYKIATTRISYNKNKIYGSGLGETGILIGNTSGNLPNGARWASYPHSYETKSFPAFRHDLVVVPKIKNIFSLSGDSVTTGIKDLIIISTGVNTKNIVYVSPHKVETFSGFWAELSGRPNAVPKTGSNGQIIGNRSVYVLRSGGFISVSSEDTAFSGLSYRKFPESGTFISGSGFTSGSDNSFVEFVNLEQVRLKQNVPLANTNFYKLYEPVYRKDAINTGTWNGIIPSGTPFQIEVVRTKNGDYGSNNLQFDFYSVNYFVSGTGVLSGNGTTHTHYIDDQSIENGLFGTFFSKKITYSNISHNQAEYIAKNRAEKDARAKLFGTLWDKGFTKSNNRVRKVVKLFNSGSWPTGSKCYEIITPSGVIIQCQQSGIATSAGIRLPNDNIIPTKCQNFYDPSNPKSCNWTGNNQLPAKTKIV